MGVGVYVTSQKSFFFLKIEWASGFHTPSEDSLELCLSQTGLAKNEKLHQTTSSKEIIKPVLDTKTSSLEYN